MVYRSGSVIVVSCLQPQFPISERCVFPEESNYTIILQDPSGAIADQTSLNSDCCAQDVCSTLNCEESFTHFPQMEGDYSITVIANNVFGQSNAGSISGIGMSMDVI